MVMLTDMGAAQSYPVHLALLQGPAHIILCHSERSDEFHMKRSFATLRMTNLAPLLGLVGVGCASSPHIPLRSMRAEESTHIFIHKSP